MSSPSHPFDGIIFDIDNVLIDTRESYLEAIRWTVEIFLTHGTIPFFSRESAKSSPTLLSAKDVENFKLLGGFNDDWDCCYGLLIYLLNLPVQTRTLSSLKKLVNIEAFAKKVKTRPLGVNGITKILERPSSVVVEKISRIFQEVYLGKGLFETVEHKKVHYWKKKGLIYKEKLIFKRPMLEKFVADGLRLGIATGRPRFEALFSLKQFGIHDLFGCLTSMDEVKKAEREKGHALRKPHPFSLLETARHMAPAKHFMYIGDLPDDMLAAHQAGKTIDIKAYAFLACAEDPKRTLSEMAHVKPDFIFHKPQELVSALAG